MPLTKYKGKWVLIVNTASKCGFTPQFQGLESMYKNLNRGTDAESARFVVLGFPCNQFGSQDPGSDEEIQGFCQLNYGVTFPIFKKIDVNGDKADPLFEFLKREKPGPLGIQRVKWNFEKFLVDPDGKVVDRWSSISKPESIERELETKFGLPPIEKSSEGKGKDKGGDEL